MENVKYENAVNVQVKNVLVAASFKFNIFQYMFKVNLVQTLRMDEFFINALDVEVVVRIPFKTVDNASSFTQWKLKTQNHKSSHCFYW